MASVTGQTVYVVITIAPWGEAACRTFATREARDRECAGFIADWLSLLHVEVQRELRELLAHEQFAAALDRYNSAADWDRQITCIDSEVRA
jgi:hypothetical protein